MKYVGKVVSIEQKSGNKGPYVRMKVDSLTITAFTPENVAGVKVGDPVEVEYTETAGTYQGKPTTYRNLVSIAVRTDKEVGAPATPGGRDRAINISVCLKAGVDLVAGLVAPGGIDGLDADKEKVVEVVKYFATEFYKFYED